jgi:cardiolipin synthase
LIDDNNIDNSNVDGMLSPEGTSENPSREIFTVANLITFCRLILTLVFLWLFGSGQSRIAALVVYVIAASSDFIDGIVARSTNSVSWFGKVLDPIVDRLLLFCGVIGLQIRGELPLWVTIFVIARDVYLAFGAQAVHKYRSRPIDVVFIGKVTTALLMTGFSDLLLGLPVIDGLGIVDVSWLPVLNSESGPVGMLFVYAGCVCSLITALIYTREGLAIRKDALANGWQKTNQQSFPNNPFF